MLLAGFLGTVVATLLPNDLLRDVPFGLGMLFMASLVGTFLPVPIGFDVAVAGALLNGGLAPGYVMALVFTLGIFSIYSFFIVAGAISLRAALLLGALIVALGIGAGWRADAYPLMADAARARHPDRLQSLRHQLGACCRGGSHSASLRENDHAITLHRTPFNPRSPAGAKPFTRLEAWHLGIDMPLEFSFADMWPPFWDGRSIACRRLQSRRPCRPGVRIDRTRSLFLFRRRQRKVHARRDADWPDQGHAGVQRRAGRRRQ